MQIVIDILEQYYNEMKEIEWYLREYGAYLDRAVLDGTILPETHGDLIDRDYLRNVILLHNFHANNKNIVPYADRKGYRQRNREVDEGIINAPTIIKATKGGGK